MSPVPSFPCLIHALTFTLHLQTAVGWGIWGGIMLLFPFVNIIKRLRYQTLALLVFSLAFTAALSRVDRSHKSQAIAFAFLTAFPIGWVETGTTLMVQLDAKDVDVGMVYCTSTNACPSHHVLQHPLPLIDQIILTVSLEP